MWRQAWRKGENKKLSPRMNGPYKVVNRISEVNWELEGGDGRRKTFHVNLIKKKENQFPQELGILRSRGRPKKTIKV